MSRRSEVPNGSPLMSRELLETGTLDAILSCDAPELRLLTDAERRRSLEAVLDLKPPGDVRLFAYGSLIWNPTIRSIDRRIARVDGWHRAFCLSTIAGRGSPERPGLVLALDEGGSCRGVAFRIAERDVEGELELLWRREMVTGAYVPRWIDLLGEDGERISRALAFTIDRSSRSYAGDLATEVQIDRLATAAGSLGSSADYLFRTRDELRACGIPDADLELLADRVERTIALCKEGCRVAADYG